LLFDAQGLLVVVDGSHHRVLVLRYNDIDSDAHVDADDESNADGFVLRIMGSRGGGAGQFMQPRGASRSPCSRFFFAPFFWFGAPHTHLPRTQVLRLMARATLLWLTTAMIACKCCGTCARKNKICTRGLDDFGCLKRISVALPHALPHSYCDGAHLRTLGSEGNGDGQFQRPYGVVVDTAARIIVSDGDNHRLQVLQ